MEKIKENLLYLFVFLLPWQTVFLVREIFVGSEKWQYGTIGVYASDVILVLILISNFKFKILNLKSIFNDKILKLKNKIQNYKLSCHSELGSESQNYWKMCSNKGILKQVRDDSKNNKSGKNRRIKETKEKKVFKFDFLKLILNFKFKILNSKIVVSYFFLWSAMSVIWSQDKPLAAYFSLKILLGIGLFFAVQKINFDFRKLIFVLLFSSAIQSGLGVWQYLSQDSFSSKWLGISNHLAWQGGTSVVENESGRWLRSYGGFEHPNIFGGFLVLVLLIIGFNFKFKILKPKLNFASYWLLVTSYFLITLGILFSFSRSAWLALFFGIVILAHGKSKEKKVFKFDFLKLILNFKLKILNLRKHLLLTLPILVFVSLIIVINFSNFSSRFDVGERLEKKSVSDRMEYIFEAEGIIKDNFWVGVGAGNYTLEVMKNDNFQKQIWKYQPVHNVFLLVFSELGLVGIILFVSFLTQVFIKANPEFYPIFGALFVFMIFDHWLWTGHFGMLFFWMTLGLMDKKHLLLEVR